MQGGDVTNVPLWFTWSLSWDCQAGTRADLRAWAVWLCSSGWPASSPHPQHPPCPLFCLQGLKYRLTSYCPRLSSLSWGSQRSKKSPNWPLEGNTMIWQLIEQWQRKALHQNEQCHDLSDAYQCHGNPRRMESSLWSPTQWNSIQQRRGRPMDAEWRKTYPTQHILYETTEKKF